MWGIAVVTSQVCTGVEAALTQRMLSKNKELAHYNEMTRVAIHLLYCASTCVQEHSQIIVSSPAIDWNFPMR